MHPLDKDGDDAVLVIMMFLGLCVVALSGLVIIAIAIARVML